MSRFDSPDWSYRRHGPAVTSAGDGMVGVYSAILHTAPSGGSCKVLIPAFSLAHYRTANCPAIFSGAVGDSVLVAFDDDKEPWVVVPSAFTLPTLAQLGIARGGGTSAVFSAATEVDITVAHGLSGTPTSVVVTGNSPDVQVSSASKTTSHFTIRFQSRSGGALSATYTADWIAVL